MTRELNHKGRWKLAADALAHADVSAEMLVRYAEGDALPKETREAVENYLASSQAARDELLIIESWRVPETNRPPTRPSSRPLVATVGRWLWNPIPAWATAAVLAAVLLFVGPVPDRESIPAQSPEAPGTDTLTPPVRRSTTAHPAPGDVLHQFGVQRPMGAPARATSSGDWIQLDLDVHNALRVRRDVLIAGLVIEVHVTSDTATEVTVRLTNAARDLSIERRVAVGPDRRAQLRVPSEWLPPGEYRATASIEPDGRHPFATRLLNVAP